MNNSKDGLMITIDNSITNRGKYEIGDLDHSIAPGEMSFFSSIVLPLFTVLLAIACFVVAFWDSESFTKQSYARVYLIISAIILLVDFTFVFIESVLANRIGNLIWEKFQKISIVFLLVAYIFLAIFGSIMISNVNEHIKFSKESAPVSLAFISVYSFILCRTLIEAGSFLAFWMFQYFKNSEKNNDLKVVDFQMGETGMQNSPQLNRSNSGIDLSEDSIQLEVQK